VAAALAGLDIVTFHLGIDRTVGDPRSELVITQAADLSDRAP
jgi:hypothetical protein